MRDAKLAGRHIAEEDPQTLYDSPKCCIVEVDLEFPQHLHDKFEEFPPCPESLTPNMDWFSDYLKEAGAKCGTITKDKCHGSDKLVPELHKHIYICHPLQKSEIKQRARGQDHEAP